MSIFEERDTFLAVIKRKQPYVVKIDGFVMQVAQDVFPPDVGQTSALLGRVLGKYRPCWALDMGCGTGYLAMILKRNGALHVFAVDNHKPALRCTRANIKRNLLGGIRVVESNLFEKISTKISFDLIVFNQPYYPTQNVMFGMGRQGGHFIIEHFLSHAQEYLTDDGVVIMPFSEFVGTMHDPKHIAAQCGYGVKVIATKRTVLGKHYIYEFRKQNGQ